MCAALRSVVCFVIIAAAGDAFGSDAPTAGEGEQQVTAVDTSAKTNSTIAPDEHADTGAASAEPARADQKAANDARSARAQASRQADEERFLQQVWSGP